MNVCISLIYIHNISYESKLSLILCIYPINRTVTFVVGEISTLFAIMCYCIIIVRILICKNVKYIDVTVTKL